MIGPGEMLAVDLKLGKLYHDRELKDYLSRQQDFGRWIKNTNPNLYVTLNSLKAKPTAAPR